MSADNPSEVVSARRNLNFRWESGVWRGSFEEIRQPVWAIGTPLFRKSSIVGGFFGSDPKRPSLTFFGNYSDEHFRVAASLIGLGQPLEDADRFEFVEAGKVGGERKPIEYFTGLRERIALAHDVLKSAPWKNYRVWRFRSTERWQTIFKGSIPLRWSNRERDS